MENESNSLEELWDKLEDYLLSGFVQSNRCTALRKRYVQDSKGPSHKSSAAATWQVHFVSCKNSVNDFTCTCANFKSFNVCSHGLAAAKDNIVLTNFISLVVKKPQKPSKKPNLAPIDTFSGSKYFGQMPNQSTRKRPRSNKLSQLEIRNKQTLKKVH